MRSSPASPGEERQLLVRARSGDGAAVEALVRHFQDRVFSVALRLTGSRADAEDVAQEAFVRAIQGLPAFRGEAGFFTWLYRITVNLARDRWREAAGPAADPSADGAGPEPPDPAPGPERAVATRQQMQRLELALGKLSPASREAFVLRHIEGLEYDAMVEILGVPAATLKMRVHRACMALRALLEDGHVDGP
ncbi:MAG TPA: sigma-70 family RNA polymerase sigma factor [Thermodesulfobacteriota bacterium]|nr:sigma-70 family RNA polymerase sigma factor [Thermodesulfobacteriota bacterium]